MAWHPFRHFGLKIAALALGTLLWITVSGHQVERRIPVAISYSNVPASFEMSADQDDVNVYVRGDDSNVNELIQGRLQMIVDLGDAHAGANLIALRTDQVVAPLGIEVLHVDPGAVNVMLEKSARQPAAIVATLEGQVPDGYVVGDVVVEPRTVEVVGPESRLKTPVSVITERIFLDGRTSTFTQEAGVMVVDSRVRLAQATRVRVVVNIRAESSK